MSAENRKTAPVGVFDSGVGGLTVAREISRQLPNENIVYFGDTARVPYGSKSKETVPVMGVVIPGARAAVEATKNRKVGVVGTDATVQSGMYTKIIREMAPDVDVIEKACPLFVPLVEEGFKEHVVTDEIIEYYLESMRNSDIDAMILGCTHYPLLRSKIRNYMGEKIQIVNPAYETAMDLKKLLAEYDMENDGSTEAHSRYSFYVSDAAEKFRRFANTVMPFDVPTTNIVNIEEF